jgi:hypothetical protein
MNEMPSMACFDARLQQARKDERFSWSGICKRGILTRRAFIPALANDNKWARVEKKSRSGKLSRRIEWRNSLWPQRFWCPLSRQPVHVSPRNPYSISSRSRPRSMLSRLPAKADTANTELRQNAGSASPLAGANKSGCLAANPCAADFSGRAFSLWSNENPSATVLMLCSREACTESWLISRISTKTDNRSFQCQNRLSLLLSVRPLFLQHVHVRRPSPNPRPCHNQSSWSRQATRADAKSFLGQAIKSDPHTARPCGIQGGRTC